MMKLLAAIVALSIAPALAQERVAGDRVYDVHTDAQPECPALNWHIVASPDGVLTGMVSWEDRKVVAMLTGTIEPVVQVERFGKPLGGNPQSRNFSGIATDAQDQQHRIANVSGTIDANGGLNVKMEGSGVVCHSVKLQLVPAPRN